MHAIKMERKEVQRQYVVAATLLPLGFAPKSARRESRDYNIRYFYSLETRDCLFMYLVAFEILFNLHERLRSYPDILTPGIFVIHA